MTGSGLVEAFNKLDLTGVPSVTSLDTDRARILWCLWIAQDKVGEVRLTPGDVTAVLRDVYLIHIPRQRVMAILDDEPRDKVARRSQRKRRAYQIMQPAIDEVVATSPSVVFIHPEQALTQYRKVETLFTQLEGELRLCDPYVDRRTLDVVGNCEKASLIKLLTANVKDANAVKGDLKIFGKQHGNVLEIRTVPPAQLHDRYLIHDNGMLLIGTSLNGLGLKQSFVVELGTDIRAAVLPVFDALWSGATAL